MVKTNKQTNLANLIRQEICLPESAFSADSLTVFLKQFRFPDAARDFSTRVNFHCRLSYGVLVYPVYLTEKPCVMVTRTGSIPRCGKGFFYQSQLSLQTLLRCSCIPCLFDWKARCNGDTYGFESPVRQGIFLPETTFSADCLTMFLHPLCVRLNSQAQWWSGFDSPVRQECCLPG